MKPSGKSLDDLSKQLSTTDNKIKLTLAANLITYLSDPENGMECEDIGIFVDVMTQWCQSSNNKISQCAIDVLTHLVDRMGTDFKPYSQSVLSTVIDRLGDNKEVVREKAQLFLLKLMERDVVSPPSLFEKLGPAFSHKNGKIREEALMCVQATMREYGAVSLGVSKQMGAIFKLLNDPTPNVRDTAFNTIVEIYRHVGEKLRVHVQKKSNINPHKLQALMTRFDEIRDAGDMLPSAIDVNPPGRMKDDTDNAAGAIPKSGRPRLGSFTKRSISTSKDTIVSSTPASGTKPCRTPSLKRPTTTVASAQTGGVDEDAFLRVFEDVPSIQLYSVREMEDQLSSIRDTIYDPNKDWSKRVDALKKLRSLIIAGAAKYEEFMPHLRLLEQPFQSAVRDLRSQVVREACVTIAYLSQELGNKLDHFSEVLLSSLINLIPNSAKIMASSGHVTIRFILRNTHHARLIPIITSNLTSKSKDIRRACCEFLELILQCWSTHLLERQLPSLQEAIRKGISDADPDARTYSRKAFWNFKSHFPDNAEQLLNSLDSSYRKTLTWDFGMSNSSSTNSLNQQSSVNTRVPSAGSSCKTHLLSAPDVSNRRGSTSTSSSRALTKVRSNSAIDLQAAQRAKARAQYAAMARHKVGSGASLPRTVRKAPSPVSSAVTSPERLGRTRNRSANISQSQPSSRSGSPSSRLSYATYVSRDMGDGRRRPTGIPVSTGTSRDASRETSPNRFMAGPSGSKLGSFRNRPAHLVNQPERQTHARPVMAQKILQQSREAETALADALTSDAVDSGEINKRSLIGRKSYRSFEEHSDDSETSSVCSERSYDSFRRSSENINDIIHNCGSILWNERKDGLVSLQSYLQNGNQLNWPELKQVMEIFTKMFMDSHTKVFSLFIDALNELILAHKEDLNDWLFILLTRLFNKLGTDLLGSIQTKLYKTLSIIRESFSLELQMNAVIRFLIDQTQTPNSKVKIAVLLYLVQIATYMETSAFNPGIDEAVSAIAKVMTWYQTAKNPEVKKAAQNAIISLFNLNTPQVTMILSQLPPEYQEAAATVVHSHLRRSSTESTPPSPSPHLQSPGTPQSLHQATIDIFDESLNPEDVYRSLHRTTAEIQNYSFDGSLSTGKPMDKEKDTSQDSGISQMLGERRETLEERINQLFVFSKDFLSDIIKKKEQGSQLHKTDHTSNRGSDVPSQGAAYNEEREVLFTVFEALQLEKGELKTSVQDCKIALNNVRQMIKNGSVSAVIDMFKDLLKSLLYILATNENRLKSVALGVLTEMFNNRKVCAHFGNFVELMVLRVLSSYSDPNKEISRAAEQCALAIGANLSANHLIGVLCPLIKTGEFPINLAAVKILTKVMERNDREIIEPNVDQIMEVLLPAYDHPESSVRKSAVFCMVALHSVVGEEILQPYLINLSASKLKLLNLYIKRSHPDVSGGCGSNV